MVSLPFISWYVCGRKQFEETNSLKWNESDAIFLHLKPTFILFLYIVVNPNGLPVAGKMTKGKQAKNFKSLYKNFQ